MARTKIAVKKDLFIDKQTGPTEKLPYWNVALEVENVKVFLADVPAIQQDISEAIYLHLTTASK